MATKEKDGPVYKKDVVLKLDTETKITLPATRVKMPWSNELTSFSEPSTEGGSKKRRIQNFNMISEQIEITMMVSDDSAYNLNTDVSRIKNATDPRDELLNMFYDMAESQQLLQLELGEDTFSPQKDSSGNSIDSYPGYIKQIRPDIEGVDHTIKVTFTFEVGVPMQA